MSFTLGIRKLNEWTLGVCMYLCQFKVFGINLEKIKMTIVENMVRCIW